MVKISRHTIGDRTFTLIVAILIVIGTATFLSASLGLLARNDTSLARLAVTQIALGLLPGIFALVFLRYLKTEYIKNLILPAYIGAILLTLVVFIPGVGVHANGATRWIDVGPVTVQPAEFLKITVVLFLALYLTKMRTKISNIRYGLLGYAVIVGVPCLVLLAQPNTSTVLVLGATTAAMYFIAGAPFRDFFIIVGVAAIGLTLLVWQRPYLMDRITTFMDPSKDALSSGYQIQQSLIAVGSGGILGRGYGQSVQKFNYLPEAVDDAIFAVYAEEFGFIGSLFLLFLFLAFATRGLMLAVQAASPFSTLAITGLVLTISISALMNIAAMLSIFPLTGLPLPFISHGGTALLTALASVGLILNFASSKKRT